MKINFSFSKLYRFRLVITLIIAAAGLCYLLLKNLLFLHTVEPALQWIIEIFVVCILAPTLVWLAMGWGERIYLNDQQTNQKLQALEGVYATALNIVSQLDIDQLLGSIVNRCVELTGAHGGYLGLYDEDKDIVRISVTYPPKLEETGMEIKRGEGLSWEVIEKGQIKILNNYLEWKNHIPQTREVPYDAVIGIPLLWQHKVIGAIMVVHWSKQKRFTEFDAWLLHPFANLDSIAINNAIKYGTVTHLSHELAQRDAQKTVQLDQTRDELFQKNIQLQDLINRMTQIQEMERSRIAMDMYDSTTQLILGALYTTQAAIEGVSSNPASARKNMTMVQNFLHKIEKDIHQTIQNLRPQILDNQGFVQALKQHTDRYSEMTGKRCNFKIEGTYTHLPEVTELTIYRIVQEALQNAATNNPTSQIDIVISCSTQNIQVVVEDLGKGYDLSNNLPIGYSGLAGMRERAEGIGATLKISSQPGQGTRMELTVPNPEAEVRQVERIRVLIVDSYQYFRYGLMSLLAQDPAIEVVGEAENSTNALDAIEKTKPEIILLDIRVHGLSGNRLAQKILHNDPEIKIILLTDFEDEDYLMEALTSGVYGYLLKNSSNQILLSAIHKVHSGEKLLDSKLTNRVLDELSEQAQKHKQSKTELTDEELRLLYHLSLGDTYEEISKTLFMSEPTVKRLVTTIQTKLGVNNRTQAVAEAIRNGLI